MADHDPPLGACLPEFDHAEPLRRRSRIKSGMTLELGDNAGKRGWRGLVAVIEPMQPHAAFRASTGRAQRSFGNRPQAAAAEALGISERGIRLYENGAQPIPKTVTLATRGYDAVASAEG